MQKVKSESAVVYELEIKKTHWIAEFSQKWAVIIESKIVKFMSLSKIALTLQGASFDQNKILRGRYHHTHIEAEIENHPAATLWRVNI